MVFIPLYRLFVFFLVSFREHFAHLIHSWICANIKVFMAILFQNFKVWMNVVLGNFWSASPEGVTGGGHQRRSSEGVIGGNGVTGGGHWRGHRRRSLEEVTRGGHRRQSPEGVTGGGHQRRSSEAVTGGGHRRGSPEGVTESIHWELLAPCWIQSYMSSNKVPQSPILSWK